MYCTRIQLDKVSRCAKTMGNFVPFIEKLEFDDIESEPGRPLGRILVFDCRHVLIVCLHTLNPSCCDSEDLRCL
jgi:hypothetical protein